MSLIKTNISTRDKKLILMLSGIVIFALGYFGAFRPLMDKADEMKTANEPLEAKLAQLEEIEENKDYYISETENYNQKVTDYTAMFPADVKEEDAIILARDMEQKTGIRAFQLDISPQELTSSLTLDDYDEDFNEIEQETDVQQLVADSSGMELYRMRNSFDFNGTYDAVKNVIDALMQDGRRMTVDSLDIDFSASTGDVGGTMVVNMYSMTGTGREYTAPDTGVTRMGSSNLFGTISSAGGADATEEQDGTGADNSADAGNAGNADNTDHTAQ